MVAIAVLESEVKSDAMWHVPQLHRYLHYRIRGCIATYIIDDEVASLD